MSDTESILEREAYAGELRDLRQIARARLERRSCCSEGVYDPA